MTDKAPFDLDAALAALAADERAARPTVTENLQVRVLGDAAMVAAERAEAAAQQRNAAQKRVQDRVQNLAQERARNRAQSGGFRWFGLFDVWSGGAVAAVAICLVVGLGVGYVAGPEVLAQAGLNDAELAFAADDGDGNFLSEDVL